MTIKEVSVLAGVSKTTIRKRIVEMKLTDTLSKDGRGIVQIPSYTAEMILQSFGEKQTGNQPETSENRKPEIGNQAIKVFGNQPETNQKPAQTGNRKPETENQTLDITTQALIDQLRFQSEQLKEKDRQIEALHNTIDSLTHNIEVLSESLGRAQALHAGTIQQQLSSGADHKAGFSQADSSKADQQPTAEKNQTSGKESENEQPVQPKQKSVIDQLLRFMKKKR